MAAVTFDLEQVLLCPKLNASSLFYRRKLATYNLTIYRLDNGEVSCHMWHEGQAGKGSCEIATCVSKFFNSLPCDVNRVILYSDMCDGQNRYLSFSTMCLSTVQAHSLEIIDHIYLESGHSQMECDSAHFTIESALKNKDIYCPTDYFRIAAMARKQKPFQVELLSTSEVLGFKGFSKEIVHNRLWDSTGPKVKWIKIRWMRYKKANPDILLFKYDYKENFRKLIVKQQTRARRSFFMASQSVPRLYQEPPAISKAKFNDLEFLCNSNAFPHSYHCFFKSLRADRELVDRLQEPDQLEVNELANEEDQ